MVPGGEAADLPWLVRRVMAVVGLQYIHLRTFAVSGEMPSLVAAPERMDGAKPAVPAGA